MLAELTRHRYPVEVVAAAVGAEECTADLHLGRDSEHSTLSTDWLDAAPTEDRWRGETIIVPVVTLSQLEGTYGLPAFVKIDVEGFEAGRCSGASAFPPALSFEYPCADRTVAEECVDPLTGFEFRARRGCCGLDEPLAQLLASARPHRERFRRYLRSTQLARPQRSYPHPTVHAHAKRRQLVGRLTR